MAVCAGHSLEWLSSPGICTGDQPWITGSWTAQVRECGLGGEEPGSLAWSLQSKWGLCWDSRMWRNSIPTGTPLEFVQRGKLHWEFCFCPSQCLETFSNELVFIYVLIWMYSLFIARKISDKSVFEVDQSFIVFVKQLSCCNRKWPEQTAKACIWSEWALPSLCWSSAPPCMLCLQEYLSALWAMWPGHLVQCVYLPPRSLPNINLMTLQGLQGEGVKWSFPESNSVVAIGSHDAVVHQCYKVLCFNFDVFFGVASVGKAV